MKKKAAINTRILKNETNSFAIAVILFALFMALIYSTDKPQMLLAADTVEVIRQGHQITVLDKLTSRKYKFTSERKRRSEADQERYTAIKTDTIKIDILPGGGLEIISAGKGYKITPIRRGR